MIAVVVVSHSRALAEAAVALAREMVGEGPVVEVAAGAADGRSGTDATAVAAALERADRANDGAGVLLLADLGSAVLSAELALELVPADLAARARVSGAALVEGLMAALVTAAGGGDLERCAQEAQEALRAKVEHVGPGAAVPAAPVDEGPPWAQVELSVVGEHGVHARPAARLVAGVGEVLAGHPGTQVRISNATTGRGPVDAVSISAVATLDARRGHVLQAQARGPGAQAALRVLEELAATGFGDLPEPTAAVVASELPVPPAMSAQPGVAGSGLEAAIGPVVLPRASSCEGVEEPGDPERERQRLDEAVSEALRRLDTLEEHARRHLGHGEAEVFAAHRLLLTDPALQTTVREAIAAGAGAGAAWSAAVAELADRFAALPDPYQRERAQDVRVVGERLLRILAGDEQPEALGEGILVVDDLDPALAISFDSRAVSGVVTRSGGGLGHGVLIARARGVPVLTGAGTAVDVPEGTVVAFDTRSRRLEVDPSEQVRADFEEMLSRREQVRGTALSDAHLPAVTRDGVRIPVRANVSSLAVARLGAGLGAEGSGLVRTEEVFAEWTLAPTVAQQAAAYRAIATAYRPHRVTIRTWDVGGDKPLRFVPGAAETNPFLGVRGVRVFRDDPSLLVDQLEAVCRVALDHPVDVLFPMVTSAEDVRLAQEWLAEAVRRCGLDDRPEGLRVGIMVEVPAVALRLRHLAQGLDVVSVGSNDLGQYTLAVERGNPRLEPWQDPLDPAVLQLIRTVCEQAPPGVVVSVCGQLAADPEAAGLLVGLGVGELSATAAAVPVVKAALRAASVAELRELADRALAARDGREVRALLAGVTR